MITIPIATTPRRALSPNQKRHWGTKAKATERARRRAKTAAEAVLSDRLLPINLEAIQRIDEIVGERGGIWITLRWTIWWEKGRKRMDDSNLIAALKPYQDGIADALGVDDKHFTTATPLVQERSKTGKPYMQCVVEIKAEIDHD